MDRSDRSRASNIDRLAEVINNLQKSLQCTICLDLMIEPTKTRCGHSFCKSCIGRVLQRKSASCPLCKKSLNRRNISKDDDLQTYIEKFNRLVIAIQTDTHVDILSHSKQPCNTRESHAGVFFSDDEIDVKPDIKIRTWLHSVPDKPNIDDLNETSIEDRAGPMNPISDNSGKSEIGEVHRDGIDASRRSSHDRKRSTDCPESINKDTLSQVNKGTRQTDEVIEIDSSASELKYNATHAKIRARENHEKNVRTKSNIEKTVNQDNSSTSHKTAYDQLHQISAPSCLSTSTSAITEQSSANWSRMVEFGKEMKRARKRKVRKLDVSTKKNENSPRIVENIKLSPGSRYDTTKIVGYNKNEKETNVSNRSELNDRKQDAIDESLDLSDAKSLSETDTRELFDKGKADCSKLTYPTMNTSYITLEEGRQIGIINVNNGTNKIVESIAEDRHREENADYRENQGRVVKFTQTGSLIRRLKTYIRYFFLGMTKRELSMPAEVRVIPVYNMQQSVSRSELHVALSPQPWNTQNSSNITVVKDISFASDSNSNEVISKEFPATSICRASATPKKDIESRLNKKKSAMIVQSSMNANQRSDKSIENVAEKVAQSPHRTSRPDKNTIHRTSSRTHPGTSNSIKLLSPDKDSQLKFLKIDSPINEREESRRANLIRLVNERNNFSEKNSRLPASTPDKAQESFIKNPCKKRKRIRCANDKESFDDEFSDGSDDSNDLINNSSQTTIIRVRRSELSKKAGSSRLDANKKRRLSSSDDQDIEVISASKKQEAPERKFKTSSSDTESESATQATKNLKRHSDQYVQRNVSIMDTATKKCLTRQDSGNLRIQNIIDKWSNEHIVTQKKLTKESKNTQNSVKSIRDPSEENSAKHQSSCSNNTLEMEKHKNVKSSQKSSARESDMFESNSLFNSENLDYILQQSTKLNVDNTSTKKIVDSSNDDIINRVLQIDRSRGNADACQPPDSAPRNDLTSQKEKDSREYLLQDNFDEIIACVEQPQSEDFVPCSEQSSRNPNRPLAKQKTSNCLAMTDESCDVMQETPIVPPSSTNDMFEQYSPRNVKKPAAMNVISSNSDKENVACSQKRRDYVSDQKDKKDAVTNADAIDKDSRKKITSKHNISREKEKFLEERNNSTRSPSRLHDDNETQRTTAGNESNSKDDTFEHDSLMNITQQQVQLQMFEEDLFGIAARKQMKKKILQKDLPQKEQHIPKKRKQNSEGKNTEPGERSADEDDIVENTPEKKLKNSGNNVKTNESRESTKIAFLSPISKTTERTPSPHQIRSILRSGASTPMNLFSICPSSQSTPIIAHNSTISNRSGIFGGSKRTERIESGSILLTKQDAKTLENVRRLPDKRDLRFVCSGLSASQITIVKEFAAKNNASYANQFDRDVTHVIVKTIGEQNAAKSTLKYLQGIAHRKWIVSYKWIEDCSRQQELLDELPYEATTQNDVGTNGAGPRNSRLRDKGLFEGFTFLCVEPYDNVSLEQYQDLLLATGAAVVNSFEVLAKKEGMKGVVIQDNIHEDKIIERWYRTAKAAPILVDWIVECIGHYKLFKLAPYIQCLSPQDFCAIGYPRELVEEEEYSDDE